MQREVYDKKKEEGIRVEYAAPSGQFDKSQISILMKF